MSTATGYLITLEGIEGCGKSTQAGLLAKRLRAMGIGCVLTREPGGTRIGREIRKVLLNLAHSKMAPEAELALYFADRAQHLREKIWPSLQQGLVVVCDRFTDSTLAYQGYGRGLPIRLIRSMDRIMTGAFRPRLTVLLDVPAEEGLSRAVVRNRRERLSRAEGRFEAERLEFHRRVRQGYLRMARRESRRFVVVSGAGRRADVHDAIWREMAPRLGL